MTPPLVFYSVLSFRKTVSVYTGFFMADIQSSPSIAIVGRAEGYGSAPHHARNLMLREALACRPADWALQIDDDAHVNGDPGRASKIIDALYFGIDAGAAVVGCPAPISRKTPIDRVERPEPNTIIAPGRRASWDQLRHPTKVHSVGSSCWWLNLAWLREHWPTWPWFDSTITANDYRGEDYWHCERVIELGGDVWAYPAFVENAGLPIPPLQSQIERVRARKRK